MNGFNNESGSVAVTAASRTARTRNPPYSYVPHSETKPYFDMGKQYVLADQMYASNFDASSFISHQYIIAAQAEASVNYPYGAWGCDGGSGDHDRQDRSGATNSSRPRAPVITTRRSVKKRTAAADLVGVLRRIHSARLSAASGAPTRRTAMSTTARIGRTTSLPRQRSSSPTFRTEICAR